MMSFVPHLEVSHHGLNGTSREYKKMIMRIVWEHLLSYHATALMDGYCDVTSPPAVAATLDRAGEECLGAISNTTKDNASSAEEEARCDGSSHKELEDFGSEME